MSSSQVPEGYKQTEIGVIPEEWEISSVGEQFDIQLGKMLDAAKNTGILKPYIGNRAVQWGYFDVSDLPLMAMSRSDLEKFRLQVGDLIVCEGGEVGRAAIWDAPIGECYYQKALHRLRVSRDFNPELMISFLKYWTDFDLLANYVSQTSIAHLTKEKLAQVPLPVPSKKEQDAIATTLSDIDALIAKLDKLIAKKRHLKTATMQQLLTGKKRLPGFGEGKGYQQTEVGVIPEDWKVLSIGDIGKVSSGGTPSRTNPSYWNGSISWITTTQIDFNVIFDSEQFITQEGINASAAKLFSPGTLLMAMYGQGKTRGKVSILGIEASTNQACAAISLNESVDQTYIFHYLMSQYEVIRDLSNTGNQENLNGLIIKSIQVAIPSKKEQRAIATVLSDIDTEIIGLETRRTKTQAIKQGMMQELLTGRTRLV